jgi:TolB-like protein/DNA-binding winged helix-turn-helix (wHTH) protein
LNQAALSLAEGTSLHLADHVLDLNREVLLDGAGAVVELRPQAYQVLRHLARNAGRLVAKEELLAAVWPGLVVTDDSLVQAVGDVRRALGERGHDIVKTIPRRGYMLVAQAESLPAAQVAPPPSQPAPPGRRRVGVGAFAALVLAGVALAGIVAVWSHRGPGPAEAGKPGDRQSIAVLAFKDPSGNGDGQLLARGLAEDLVGELARLQDLRVVSHQSSFHFDASVVPLAQIGQALRSRFLVDGTVRREGERLRINVELLDSRDGQVVGSWRRLVDRAGLAAEQEALVGRIAGGLQYRIRDTEERRALARPPNSLDVYVLTRHGKSMMEKYSPEGMREARRFFEQALASDPNYAQAWVFLGMTNTIDAGLRLTGDWSPARMPEVLAQVERAVALAPELPIAYVALSQAQSVARDFRGALASAERCMQLSPNDADCLYIIGKAEMELGDSEPAARHMAQAFDRNPLPPAYLPSFYATALWASRRYEEALRATEDCLLKAPDVWRCRQDRIAALVELGRLPEAKKEAQALMERVPKMTAARFGQVFADSAVDLRERRIAAAEAAGKPPRASP